MDELTKRFGDLAQQYGPNVVQAALEAARVEAYSTLASSLISAAFAVAFIWAARWCWKHNVIDDLDIPWGKVGGIVSAIGAIICLAITIWCWADPWTWAAINHPELWIAKTILKI